MSDKPTIGWVPCQWTPKQGPKIQCVACNRRVRHGVKHYNDGNPPLRVMCEYCFRLIMSPDNATAPPGTPGFDQEAPQ